MFPDSNFVPFLISSIRATCLTYRPSCDDINIRRGVGIMKLLILQFSPSSCCSLLHSDILCITLSCRRIHPSPRPFVTIHNISVIVRGCLTHVQLLNWRSTTCRPSATAYSAQSQLHSVSHIVVTRGPLNVDTHAASFILPLKF